MAYSKYRNRITFVDGIRFHSKKEATRYGVLKEEEERGDIQNLLLQVPFKMSILGVHWATYIADFTYTINGISRVEDVKGVRTAAYSLKKRAMKIIHGISIFET